MKKENNKLIPKLRFREFEGEWQKDSTKKLVSFIKDGTHGTHKDTPDGGHYLLSAKNIVNGAIILNDDERKISKSEFDKITRSYRLKENDILVTIVGSIGQLALHKHQTNYAFQRSVAFLRFSKIEPKYAFHYLNSYYYQNELMKRKVTSAQPGIYLGELSKIDISFPSHPEQQKIASFLTAVDKRIEQLTKKKKLLEEYKKGVMQKIFNQEIRFKDENGNDFPEWEEKRLGEIGETYSGLNGKSAEDFGSGEPFITYMQVYSSPEVDKAFGAVRISEGERQNEVKFGDVLFTTSSETPNEVGYSSVFLTKITPIYLNSFCFGYRIKNHKDLSPYFAQYLFRSQPFRKLMYKLAQGSTRYNLSKNEMLKHSVYITPSIEEQEKIYGLIKIIDEEIEAFKNSIIFTTKFKRALLQQMFI